MLLCFWMFLLNSKNILQKFRKCLAQPINLLNLKQGKIMHDYGGTHTYQTIHLPFKKNTKFWCHILLLFKPEITKLLYPSVMFPIAILLTKIKPYYYALTSRLT